jgi:poly(A) polymerase
MCDLPKLPPQPWMTAPPTRAVLAALTAGGAEVRFVGGCVRDAVLGRAVKDIDIATHDPPETVMALLTAAGITAIPTGIAHGTVTAVADGAHFEITTLRQDVETFGRHARVAFTDDWTEDAARRDLTINAVFCSPDGTLFDPFGGLADLAQGRIRFVGRARDRIREDVLRLLRFFRFYAFYGRPPADAEALAAAAELAPELPKLSGERVAAELLRLLAAPDPVEPLRLMQGAGIFPHLLPEGIDLALLEGLAAIEPRDPPDPLLRLASLVGDKPDAARRLALRLRFSVKQRERLAALCQPVDLPGAGDEAAVRRAIYGLGQARFRDAVRLGGAARIVAGEGAAGAAAWAAALLQAAAWTPPVFPLKGKDVRARGREPGPAIGEFLREVEAWWIAGDFRADRKACLAELERRIAATQER